MPPGHRLLLALLAALLLCLLVAGLLAPRAVGGGALALQLGDVMAVCRVLHDDPVIRVVENFMTPAECEELVLHYAGTLQPSTVADDLDNTINRPNPNRTSWSAFLPAGRAGDLVERVERRAVALTGKPLRHMETLQLVRYEPPGQHYAPHFDFFHNDPESQRTVTCFVYLSTLDEAPTRFTQLGLDVLPRQGWACVWDNCPAHGRGQRCDRRLEHAGMPVRTATKHGLNIWFRSLPFRT